MPTLNNAQFLFSECKWRLLQEIERRGEKCAIGDVWAVDLHGVLKFIQSNMSGLANHVIEAQKLIDLIEKRLHSFNSRHYDKLAVDVNLFKPVFHEDPTETHHIEKAWRYCTTTEDHAHYGAFWKSLHPACEWGGDRIGKDGKPDPDGNHYSVNPDKV